MRTIEYAVSPIHYIIGRDDTDTASAFITDLRNGELSRDLNVYRGFSPATSTTAEGLASPNWGYTFKIRDDGTGPFQGIYAGAGLYFSMKTAAEIDPALAAIFASPTPVYIPNTSFYMSNDTESQFGMAITGGYRARLTWPGGGAGNGIGNDAIEGLYLGANYHYLLGFGYEHFEPDARLDTDAQGLLFVNTAKGVPVRLCGPRRATEPASPWTWASRPSWTGGKWGSASTASETASTGRTWSARRTCSIVSSPAASSSTFLRSLWPTRASSFQWMSGPTARTTAALDRYLRIRTWLQRHHVPRRLRAAARSLSASRRRPLRQGAMGADGRRRVRFLRSLWRGRRPVRHERQPRAATSPCHCGLVPIDTAGRMKRERVGVVRIHTARANASAKFITSHRVSERDPPSGDAFGDPGLSQDSSAGDGDWRAGGGANERGVTGRLGKA